jgi:predicted regulator of Ras-like GTPase activity (Roadblock/LC7/MglB family)
VSRQLRSSLFLIADLDAVVSDALQAHLPAALHWDVHSFAAPADVTELGTWDAPHLVVMVCAHADAQPCAYLMGLLAHAKHHWPQTSFVFASAHPLPQMEALFERFGVMPVADTTQPAALARTILREMEQHSTGSVQGVSLPSFLQMMEWDQKSVAVRVATKERWGRLHLRQGRLVDAYAHPSDAVGEAAALEIMGWDGLELSLERSYHNAATVIQRSLTTLLMEAMQRKDEALQAPPARPPVSPLTDELEEALMFRRPKHSTAQLNKPGATPSLSVAASPAMPSAALPAPSWAHQENFMTNVKDTLNTAMKEIDGIMAAALVEYGSGMALGTAGSGLDLELAAAGNSDVVRAKMKTMEMLGIQGEIEDILITLHSQYHIIYIVPDQPLFLYLVLAKDKTNLAMSRYKIKALAKDISIT